MELEKSKKFYIEMCSKTPEIQKLWKPSIGDYYWRKSGEKVYLLIKKQLTNKKDCVWLPTEKQLFAVVCKHYGVWNWRDLDKVAADVYDFYLRAIGDYPSKEVCALGGIMLYTFNRRWREGEWG